jgi:hypothetical protein
MNIHNKLIGDSLSRAEDRRASEAHRAIEDREDRKFARWPTAAVEVEVEIINLTPHPIVFMRRSPYMQMPDIVSTPLPPATTPARVVVTREKCRSLTASGIPLDVYRLVYGEVTGLPEPCEGVIFLVSAVVAQRVPTRCDVYTVDDLVRDDEGRVVGARALSTSTLV